MVQSLNVSIRLERSGKMFSPSSDIGKAIKRSLIDISSEMVGHVHDELYPGHGWVTGRLRGSIGARQFSDLGYEIRSGAVTGPPVPYAYWIETGKRNGQKTRFRGYKMFEKTSQKWNSNRSRIDKIVLKHTLDELE